MNKQILEVVSAVSIEKDVDKEIIFEALEEAISSATKKLIGEMSLVNVKINRDTGDYETFREWDIVDEDELEDESFQILKENAKDKDDNGKVSKKIDNIDFGRISAQAAKQVIIQKVREAERTKITSKYENLIGQVVLGQIKRINKDFLLVEIEEDLNAQIPRDQIIPGRDF
jgi:NusA N-terminal domain.